MKKNVIIVLIFILSVPLFAQSGRVHWKKKTVTVRPDLELFHSTQVVNLPTAESIRTGEFEYEISHRFLPSVGTDGAYFGIDGPAHMRMALAYGITSRLLVNVGRSNFDDQVDVRFKYKAFQLRNKTAPLLAAVRGGVAWTTQVSGREKTDSRNFQYYGQLILNTLLFEKIGVGLVPSYLYNSHIYCADTPYSFTVGSYIQYYAASSWSLYLEMNNTVSGYRHSYDAVALGVELETGGHFFKLFFTNSSALNPAQFLSGADLKYLNGSLGESWRLGFNITRILKF